MQCHPRFYYYYKDYDLLPLLLFPFYSNKTHFKENRLKIIIRQIPSPPRSDETINKTNNNNNRPIQTL